MSRSRILRLENAQQFTAINVLSDPGEIGGPEIRAAITTGATWTALAALTVSPGPIAFVAHPGT